MSEHGDDLSEAGLAALRRLSIDELRSAWRSRFRDAPPQLRSKDLFVRAFVHRLELRRAGVAPGLHRKRLLALAERFAVNADYAPASRPAIAPGTAFIRDWHGKRHVVFATPEGYRYGEKIYASLSAVAFAITGTKWSGPKFFKPTTPASL